MNKEIRSQVHQVLLSRRQAIADAWYEAIAQTGFASPRTSEVRQYLHESTEAAIALLLADSFDQDRAKAIGASLAGLHHPESNGLGRTQAVLAQQLVEALSAEQVVALQPRLAALLGGLAAGFVDQIHATILVQQEKVRGALSNALQESRQALQKAYKDVEQQVQERTAELRATNEQLKREILEREHTQEELRQSARQWHATFNAINDTIFLLDLKGRIQRCNESAAEMLERPLGEIVGHHFWELLHDASGPIEECPVVRLWETHRRETRVWRGDGRWFHVSADPVLDEHGDLIGAVHIMSDITERKQTEEALRESEVSLARAQQIAHLGNWDWDVKSETLTWSDEVYRIFGVEKELELTYEGIEAMVHPDDREKNQEFVNELLATADSAEIELRITRADGEERYIYQNAEVWRDEAGNAKRIFGIVQDITERKRAEESLQRREAEFRSLAENLPDVVSRFDGDLRHTYINRQIEPVTGIPPGQFLGKTNRELGMPDELVELWDRELTKAFETTQVSTLEFAFPSPHGLRYSESRIVPECDPNGSVETVLVINRDITERKRAEEEREATYLKHQSLIRALGEVTYEHLVPERIINWSEAFEQVLGYSESEMGNDEESWTDRVHPDDLPAVESEFDRAFRENDLSDLEYRFRHKSGEYLWVHHRGVMHAGEDGELAKVIGVMKDITERKHTEEEKARSQRLLLALSQAAQAMQRARTPEDVYAIMSEEIARLGHNATVFTLTDDRAHLAVHHMTFKPALVRTVEKLTGLSAQGYRFPLVPGGHFQRVITEGETKFASGKLAAEYLAEALPTPVRPLARQTTTLLGIERSIVAPLTVSGETLGVLAVSGTDLSELVVPAVDAFANQAAIAIENARLYQKVRRDADQLEERVAERTRELATLYSVTALTSQSLELQATLERALAQVLAAVESDIGTIHLLDEGDGPLDEVTMRLIVQRGIPTDIVTEIESIPPREKPAWWVVEHNEPLLVPDVTPDPRMASPPLTEPWSYLGMPMRAGGQTLGVLSLVRRIGQPQFNVEELSLLTSVADQLGTAVERARLRQRAEQAARREERERLGWDLHDSITQLLCSMNLFAKSGRNAYSLGNMEELEHCLAELGEIGQQALKEMRLLVFELRPSALERDGLIGALQRRLDSVESRVGMTSQLLAGEVIALPERLEERLYHIAMEALNNALTHAQATSVSVSLDADSEGIHLEVVDNGSGFDPHAVESKGGLGLVNMRQRADRLGGVLTIASAPGEGTRVRVTVPHTQGE